MRKLISLSVILLFIAFAFAPSINANVSKDELVEFSTDICGINVGNFLILGTGDISWIHAENLSWNFGGKYRKLYRSNLIFHNGPGMSLGRYCFFIKDLETGEILRKDSLSRHIYLNDFFGYLRANYYCYHPHGPVGFYFTIVGFSKNYYEWEH
jgi:hypothetical protein